MADSRIVRLSAPTITSAQFVAPFFTDRLPAELRIRIYKEVLSCKYSLMLAHHEYPNEARFGVSLLTTCKAIYNEASHILYEVNTILLWRRNELSNAVLKDHRFLRSVRHLELVNLDIPAWLPANVADLHGMLDACLTLPSLKILTIAGDVKGTGLIDYMEDAFGPSKVECVAIGDIRIDIHERVEVLIKHYGMSQALQKLVTARPVKLNREWEEYREEARAAGQHALRCDFVADCDLPMFCFLVDLMRKPLQHLTTEMASFVLDFKARIAWKGKAYKALASLAAGSGLKQVLLRKPDAQTPRMLTETILELALVFPCIVVL